MSDLRIEIGNFLRNEYLEKRISIELAAKIAEDLENTLSLKVNKETERHLALANLGTTYPIINGLIVKYLASI